MQECLITIRGKGTKSFLPITYVSGIFAGCQKLGNFEKGGLCYLHDL